MRRIFYITLSAGLMTTTALVAGFDQDQLVFADHGQNISLVKDEVGSEGIEEAGIDAEDNHKTLADIEKVGALSDPLHEDINAILASGTTAETIVQITSDADATLAATTHLTSTIANAYSDPIVLLQADALTISIADRQQMLAPRMSKNICLLSTNINTEGAKAELQADVGMFRTAAMALRNGMQEAGITPPPSDEVAAGLDAVIAEWTTIEPQLAAIIESGDVPAADQEVILTKLNCIADMMHALESRYSENSKLNL